MKKFLTLLIIMSSLLLVSIYNSQAVYAKSQNDIDYFSYHFEALLQNPDSIYWYYIFENKNRDLVYPLNLIDYDELFDYINVDFTDEQIEKIIVKNYKTKYKEAFEKHGDNAYKIAMADYCWKNKTGSSFINVLTGYIKPQEQVTNYVILKGLKFTEKNSLTLLKYIKAIVTKDKGFFMDQLIDLLEDRGLTGTEKELVDQVKDALDDSINYVKNVTKDGTVKATSKELKKKIKSGINKKLEKVMGFSDLESLLEKSFPAQLCDAKLISKDRLTKKTQTVKVGKIANLNLQVNGNRLGNNILYHIDKPECVQIVQTKDITAIVGLKKGTTTVKAFMFGLPDCFEFKIKVK